MKNCVVLLLSLVVSFSAVAANPKALIKTTKGDITIELYPEQAPITVENFIRYAKEGFYDGTVFHRVARRFVIQGGGYTKDLEEKETHEPIQNESDNKLRNDRGTVAMARGEDPHSADSQFFINLRMNPSLNYRYKTFGYTVFANVIDGMHVVKEIGRIPSRQEGEFSDLPKVLVEILSVEILEE